MKQKEALQAYKVAMQVMKEITRREETGETLYIGPKVNVGEQHPDYREEAYELAEFVVDQLRGEFADVRAKEEGTIPGIGPDFQWCEVCGSYHIYPPKKETLCFKESEYGKTICSCGHTRSAHVLAKDRCREFKCVASGCVCVDFYNPVPVDAEVAGNVTTDAEKLADQIITALQPHLKRIADACIDLGSEAGVNDQKATDAPVKAFCESDDYRESFHRYAVAAMTNMMKDSVFYNRSGWPANISDAAIRIAAALATSEQRFCDERKESNL